MTCDVTVNNRLIQRLVQQLRATCNGHATTKNQIRIALADKDCRTSTTAPPQRVTVPGCVCGKNRTHQVVLPLWTSTIER
ncbi:uncharacterized protein LOC135377525 isoform X2 [Ornithodoros turicata]|uniref:uncharacterized protein LOC135377525 isoform X2 n=1 Tax=Ornithodoros turicata TaxID=34597 RepID=UPI0031390E77